MTTAVYSYEDLKRDVQQKLNELWEEQNSVEVIVTYDCIESEFRNSLREELLIDEYKAVRLSESTYWLSKKLTLSQCHVLAQEIVDLYKQHINESKQPASHSMVRILVPHGKEFRKIDIPLKS
ncbi:MAG: hypothetical protein ACJ77K_06570 [Bacteroidia bacterium]